MGRIGRGLVTGGVLLFAWLMDGCQSPDQPPPPELRFMFREWTFSKITREGASEERIGDVRERIGPGTVAEAVDFGPLLIFPLGAAPNATGEVFSNDDGSTYWAATAAPAGSLTTSTIGNVVQLRQEQWYRKTANNATLTLVLSKAFLEAIDANNGLPLPAECPWHTGTSFADCVRVMQSWVGFEVESFSYADQQFLLKSSGWAELNGWTGNFGIEVYTGEQSTRKLWDQANFDFDPDVSDVGGTNAQLFLTAPITISIPLATVDTGQDFSVSTVLTVGTSNHRQRESYLSAYLRDPQGATGLGLSYAGLEPIEEPAPVPAGILVEAPACAGGGGSGGSLQFEGTAFAEPEIIGNGASVVVTRTGGSSGAVSARVTTTGGSATAGSDYATLSTVVIFGDGEDGARAVRIPIMGDGVEEPNETVTLTLTDAKGCGGLGQPTSATLLILDADRPIVSDPTFTVGGTVSGLAGTGLLITNLGTDLTPGNGPFTFGLEYAAGLPYDVRVLTQPSNPDQVCTIANGAGTITDHDITSIAVTCVTPVPNGALDPTYGAAGKVTAGLPDGAVALALQTDGKSVVVGGGSVARYTTAGTPDSSFGGTGVVPVSFSGGLLDELQGVAIQPDGKIVVVGFARVGSQDDFSVARLTPAGGFDGSFGTGGKVTTDFNGAVDKAWSVLIQPDAAIVVAGHAGTSTPLGLNNDFAVARYRPTGALDSTFGTGGKVITDIAGRTDLAFAAALQSDGKILVAGRVADGGGDNPDVGLVRYTTAGVPDAAGFAGQGIVRADLTGNWDEASEIVIQPDGAILVSVQGVVGGSFDFMVARFTTGGVLDGSFGSGGVASTPIGTQNDFAKGLALQGDGKIVVVGNSTLTGLDFSVARFLGTGGLDTGFGDGGKVTVDFFGGGDGAEAVAVQTDGRIVVAGGASNGSSFRVGMIRIVP